MTKTILFNIIICQWGKGQVVGGNNIPVGKGNTFSGGIVSVVETGNVTPLGETTQIGGGIRLSGRNVSQS